MAFIIPRAVGPRLKISYKIKKISYSLLENIISCHVTLYRVFLKRYAGLDTLLPYELLIIE